MRSIFTFWEKEHSISCLHCCFFSIAICVGFNSEVMKYKCIIVEDDPLAIKILTRYFELVPQLELTASCHNALQAIEILNKKGADLIFVDVKLPMISGPDFVRTLSNTPPIIFTTGHDDFAVEAFELGAVDFLLKPISFERFLKAVNRFFELRKNGRSENSKSLPDFLCFKTERKMMRVPPESIVYIESFKDYIIIHRINEPDLRVKQALNCVEKLLSSDSFVRIHRSFIVSVNKITAYTNHHVELGKVEIPIGRKYKGSLNQ